MSEKLTKEEIAALRVGPFIGPEIGSNFWPMLCLQDDDGTEIAGEVIDSLARRGLFKAASRTKAWVVAGSDDLEMPDVDCRYNYDLTEAGRRALEGEKP